MERENMEEGLLSGDGNQSREFLPPRPPTHPPVTAALFLSTLVTICGSFCYGFAVGYSSPVESGIMEDLGLSTAAYSVFGSIMTIGGMIGAIVSGKIADHIGRKRTMWLSELFCTPGWLAIAFAKDAWWLDIGRLLIGFGIGIISYVVPVYVAGITPKNIRGRFTSACQLTITTSFALVYFIGTMISWRTLALLGTIPCIAQIVGLFFITESPRWLAKVGKEKEFEAALQYLRGRDTDISEEASDIIDYMETFSQESSASFFDLFQRKYLNSLIVGVGIMLLQEFGGNSALAYYASSIFEAANFPSSTGTKIAAAIQIPVAIFALLLMDKSGRRPLLLVSASGMFLFYFLLGLSFYFQGLDYWKQFTPIMALISLLGCGVSFTIGMSGIPWIIMSEIFPINVKAVAGSLVTLVSWACSFVTTYSFNFLMEWSSAGTFFLFSGVGALSVLFVAKLVPETKGRTLEEIQASLVSL